MIDSKGKKMSDQKKALIAMSGGVDSSVAALLTKGKGYDCMGCTMRLYENDIVGMDLLGTCCSIKDTGDARAVCDRIGIPYNIYHRQCWAQGKNCLIHLKFSTRDLLFWIKTDI